MGLNFSRPIINFTLVNIIGLGSIGTGVRRFGRRVIA
jgi:hypothetical protein